jgi:protein O-GlcNAc transferase
LRPASHLVIIYVMATISKALSIAIQYHQAGRLLAAEQIYRQILAVEPNHADAIQLLGVMAQQWGKHAIAVEYIGRAIGLKDNVAAFHNNLGEAYRALRRIPEAVACYRRALELEPDYAEAHSNLGNVSKDQGNLDVAIACYRRALELKPDFAEAHYNLGVAFKDQGELDAAVVCCRRALELKPHLAEAYNNLGVIFKDQGKLDESLACYRRALALKPDFAEAHSNLLFTLQNCAGVTLAALAEAHAEYDRRHAAPLGSDVAQREKVRERRGRLRLGFVSPDLRRHPVGYFLVRVLENLDQQQHETVFYSDRTLKDDLTQRLQSAATQWRDVMDMSDQRLAEQIQADGIDILFDTRLATGCWSSPASRPPCKSPGSAIRRRPACQRWTTCSPIATWSP